MKESTQVPPELRQMPLSRRRFVGTLIGLVGSLLLRPTTGRGAATPTDRERVLILGGGFAGAMTALTLKTLLPRLEVTVIERDPSFVSMPCALDYLFGISGWGEMSRGYEALASRGIRVVRSEVEGIEPERQVVRTAAGPERYAFAVVATGIRLASDEIAGLPEKADTNASLYDRERLTELRRRVEAYRGGVILVSVPPPPLQCPPAPYEFALLLADAIRRRKLRGKIVLLDANTGPQPASLAESFEAALERNRDVIEYIRSVRVAAVDAGARKVITADREEFAYDLLSLIPPHRAARFIQESGLAAPGDPFVDVDPLTLRSPRFDTLYAVGDAARTPYARTASAAAVTAAICAQQIAKTLGATVSPPETFQSVCYPYMSREKAVALTVEYRVEERAGVREVETRVVADTRPRGEYVAERRAKQRALLRSLFGK